MRVRLRDVLTYDAFLLAVAVVAGRAATALHEVVGHGAVAAALGATVRGFDLTLLGGGQAHYGFGPGVGAFARAATAAGGVAVTVVAGALALIAAGRVRLPWGIFWAVLGIESVLSSTSYVAKGLYYGVGDAASVVWAIDGPRALLDLQLGNGRLWIVFTAALPLLTALALGVYLPLQDRFFPPRNGLGRLRTTALTVGLVAVAYFALFRAADRYVAPQDPAALQARWEGARELAFRQQRTLSVLDQLRAENPGVPDDVLRGEAAQQMKRTPSPPSEVPRALPLGVILVLLEIGGTVAIVFRLRPEGAAPALRFEPAHAAYAGAAAAAVLLALFMVGQRL